jgi:hypothetical protein
MTSTSLLELKHNNKTKTRIFMAPKVCEANGRVCLKPKNRNSHWAQNNGQKQRQREQKKQ